MENEILRRYQEGPTAFSNAYRIQQSFGAKKPDIKLIEQVLNEAAPEYSKSRVKYAKAAPEMPVIAFGINQIWQADILFLKKFKHYIGALIW